MENKKREKRLCNWCPSVELDVSADGHRDVLYSVHEFRLQVAAHCECQTEIVFYIFFWLMPASPFDFLLLLAFNSSLLLQNELNSRLKFQRNRRDNSRAKAGHNKCGNIKLLYSH